MTEFKESKISAHHNYLVNDLLTPGFLVGDPNSARGFYFLADLVPPGESTPRISARLFDEQGDLLLVLSRDGIPENPAGCAYQSISGGFQLLLPSTRPLLEVRTQSFPRGQLTRIKGRLFDEHGNLRVEPLGESIRVHGGAILCLEAPYTFPTGKPPVP